MCRLALFLSRYISLTSPQASKDPAQSLVLWTFFVLIVDLLCFHYVRLFHCEYPDDENDICIFQGPEGPSGPIGPAGIPGSRVSSLTYLIFFCYS